jgi:hypothetical protein
LVSYFAGRAGGHRPRPRVQDASCLRSGCHTTEKIADVAYPIKDVKFVHAKHLQPDPNAVAKNAKALSKLTGELRGLLGEADFQAVHELAIRVGDPERNQQDVIHLAQRASSQPAVAKLAVDYARTVHLDIRLRQVANLRCSTCHAHNDDGKHFSVRRQVCSLCHFINQEFNTDTARCLLCHTPPAITVAVHGKGLKVTPGVSTRQAGMMDHAAIIANNVNCISCHADLVIGTGEVTRQRCAACHDLPEYFKVFDGKLNADSVASLHNVHTSNLHASCTECHDEIDHRLAPKETFAQKGGFFRSVLENCAHCHPNHHFRQVELLTGEAPSPVPAGTPNAMFGSRTNCLGCHTSQTQDVKGMPVIEATKKACLICHSEDYSQLFDQWINRMAAGVKDAEFLEAHAGELLRRMGEGRTAVSTLASDAVAKGQAALELVRLGQGIHNRNYALELLDYASDQFERAIAAMSGPTTPSRPSK